MLGAKTHTSAPRWENFDADNTTVILFPNASTPQRNLRFSFKYIYFYCFMVSQMRMDRSTRLNCFIYVKCYALKLFKENNTPLSHINEGGELCLLEGSEGLYRPCS